MESKSPPFDRLRAGSVANDATRVAHPLHEPASTAVQKNGEPKLPK